MILSDATRRWYEVKFYYFCFDLYHIRKNMLDVMYAIEALAQIGEFNIKDVKTLAGKLLSDPYYLPTRDELILLCALFGVPRKTIAEYVERSTSAVNTFIQNKKDTYSPYPRLSINEDEELGKIVKLIDIIKKAGI